MESKFFFREEIFFKQTFRLVALKWCEPNSVLSALTVHPSISRSVRLLSAVPDPVRQQLQYSKNQTSGPALEAQPSTLPPAALQSYNNRNAKICGSLSLNYFTANHVSFSFCKFLHNLATLRKGVNVDLLVASVLK